jgi:ribose 5-phosphate isomerase A
MIPVARGASPLCHLDTLCGFVSSPAMNSADQQELKRAAAARALDFVEDGMKLGLGTGSTADLFLELLANRVRDGLRIRGTPTSERTADKARALGLSIHELDELGSLDLAIDGADEADGNLDLIKGGGGALLREKIVAASAARMLVIADESKLVSWLGAFAVPVEVVPFGHGTTRTRICAAAKKLGYGELAPILRAKDGQVFRTDSGNLIYDCPFRAIADVPALAAALSALTGVVEHGLFVDMASVLIIAGTSGVRVRERSSPRKA